MTWSIHVTVSRDGKELFSSRFERVPILIGASSRCDVVLASPEVSSQHATLLLSAGRLVVRDTSSNGSFVHGERITECDLGGTGSLSIPPYDLQLELEIDDSPRITLRGQLSEMLDRVKNMTPEEAAAAESYDPEVVPTYSEARMAYSEPIEPVPPGASDAQVGGEDARAADAAPETPAEDAGTAAPQPEPAASAESDAPEDAPEGAPEDAPEDAVEDDEPEQATQDSARHSAERTRVVAPWRFGHVVARLEVIEAPAAYSGSVFELPQRSIRIGRSVEADLRIDDPSLSRLHAILYYVPGRSYHVADLDSTNGTFVNGERIQQHHLQHGDRLKLGKVELKVHLVNPED